MVPDGSVNLISQTARLLIMDACGLSTPEYDEMKKGWMDSIGKPGMYTVSDGGGVFVIEECPESSRPSMSTTIGRSRVPM